VPGPAALVRAKSRGPLLQVLKTSVGAIAAWLLSSLLVQQQLPIFAAIAALLVVQPSVNQSLAKGVERSVGVILGVVLAYFAGLLFGTASIVVLGSIVASLLVAWLLKLTPGSSNQIPISAMLVLVLGGQTPGYAGDRILETVIGAAVGLVVNAAIVPPVLVAPARLSVSRLSAGVASALERLADSLTGPRDRAALDELLRQARELRPAQVKAAIDLEQAEESLTLNPRAARHRRALADDRALLDRLSVLVTRTIGMTRAVHDNHDDTLQDEPVVVAIAEELRRAGHDVRLMARDLGGGSPAGGTARGGTDRAGAGPGAAPTAPSSGGSTPDHLAEEPALTAPLRILRPEAGHWVLVGSLLEDIRRIREEIVGRPAG